MNFFVSILKYDQLVKTGGFQKELSWFLRSSLSIHAQLSGRGCYSGAYQWAGFLRMRAK